MKKLFFTAVFALTALLTFAQAKTWTSDLGHSRLGFTVEHLTISDISGYFGDFTVNVTTSKDDYSDAQIELIAQAGSIDTGIEARDNHLRAADFFDVETFPTITFKSNAFEKTGEKTAKLKGNLTMRGVTKPVELNVLYKGSVINPMSQKETAGFTITGTLKRSDFGIATDVPEMILGDEIQIIANTEFSPNN